MKFISKQLIVAALAVAIFGAAQTARAQGLLGWFFGGGQCYNGTCYSGQCYGRSCSTGQCYGGQCYGRSCSTGQCYGGQCYGRSCSTGQCANGQCSIVPQTEKAASFESAIATKDEDKFSDPAPLGDDFNPLEELDEQAPTCSPCQPVAAIEAAPTKKRPIVEGLKAAASAVAENAYLARVNRVRAQYGRAPLALDAALDSQCAASCQNMASAGYIFHAPGCGAEIVAANGSRGIDGALSQWLWSSAHAAHLLSPNYTRCGVQTYVDSRGRNYCAMRFR